MKQRSFDPCPCDFPDPTLAPDDVDLIAISAWDEFGNRLHVADEAQWPKVTVYGSNWSPEILQRAYRMGMFPMPLETGSDSSGIGWWAPSRRAIFELDTIRVTKSLRKSAGKFKLTCDKEFELVVRACGNPQRTHGWINEHVVEAYGELHRLGLAHSVEVWRDGDLVGGLYGVSVGGVFAGESMFHLVADASKVALLGLAQVLRDEVPRIIDTQWLTPHLQSLGAIEVSRTDYAAILPGLVDLPNPVFPAKVQVAF